MLEVNKAEYAGGYNINLVFNNGRTVTANLEESIFNDNRPVFSALKETSSFRSFEVKHSTVVWHCGLDLAAEYLFYLAFRNDAELQEQFRQWGYVAEEDTSRALARAEPLPPV